MDDDAKLTVTKPLSEGYRHALNDMLSDYSYVAVLDALAALAERRRASAEREAAQTTDKAKRTELNGRMRRWERAKTGTEALVQRLLEIGPGSKCQ
jgi:hypothetical protein